MRQPLEIPILRALAPLPARGHPLRAVREREGPPRGRRRLLRPLQPGAPANIVHHRVQARDRSVNALSTSDVGCFQATRVLRASGGRPARMFKYTPRVWAVSLAWSRVTRPQMVLA